LNRKRIFLLLFGLLLSCGSGYAIYQLSGSAVKEVPVAVAAQEIGSLERFTADNVKIAYIAEKYVPAAAVSSLAALTGKLAAVTIYAGEQILAGRIYAGSITAKEGERYLFIPVRNVAYRPGELIDVYLVYTPGKSKYSGAEAVLTDKVVATVVDEGGKDLYGGLLAKVQPQVQAGVEILVSPEETTLYLERLLYAKEVLVRHGKGGTHT